MIVLLDTDVLIDLEADPAFGANPAFDPEGLTLARSRDREIETGASKPLTHQEFRGFTGDGKGMKVEYHAKTASDLNRAVAHDNELREALGDALRAEVYAAIDRICRRQHTEACQTLAYAPLTPSSCYDVAHRGLFGHILYATLW